MKGIRAGIAPKQTNQSHGNNDRNKKSPVLDPMIRRDMRRNRSFVMMLVPLAAMLQVVTVVPTTQQADAFLLDPSPSSATGRIPRSSRSKALLRPPRKNVPVARTPSVTTKAQNDDDSENKSAAPKSSGFPLSLVLLGLIALRSFLQLFGPTEIPGNFLVGDGRPAIDWIGTAFDVFFVGYGIQNIGQQTGILSSGSSPAPSLSSPDVSTTGTVEAALVGTECRATLDIGREPGTWMDEEWGASGARFLLPVRFRFSPDPVDLGVPGEEALGGRYCRRLEAVDPYASFVTPTGEVRTRVGDGGWAVRPLSGSGGGSDEGAAGLRFFLDFPDGATKNDLSVAPGTRVFFSGACFAPGADPPRLGPAESLVGDDSGARFLNTGGLTIKRNNVWNGWGALGDVNLKFGRFRIGSVADANDDGDRSPMQ